MVKVIDVTRERECLEAKRRVKRPVGEILDDINQTLKRINENLYFLEQNTRKEEKLPFEPCDD